MNVYLLSCICILTFISIIIIVVSIITYFERCQEIDLTDFEQKIFSQNGEDVVTIKLIEIIYGDDCYDKYFVEFGVEDGNECNTRILREKYNWKGLQMDGNNENKSINLQKEFITKDNIRNLFQKYNVPEHINILSVDIDYNDFYCLKSILDNYTCDIIICEYNSTHLPNEDKIIIYKEDGVWDQTNYFGTSLLALDKLGKNYNYSIIYCDNKGVNCFLVHNDILTEKKIKFKNSDDICKIYKEPKYSNGPNGGHKADVYNREYITFNEAILL